MTNWLCRLNIKDEWKQLAEAIENDSNINEVIDRTKATISLKLKFRGKAYVKIREKYPDFKFLEPLSIEMQLKSHNIFVGSGIYPDSEEVIDELTTLCGNLEGVQTPDEFDDWMNDLYDFGDWLILDNPRSKLCWIAVQGGM